MKSLTGTALLNVLSTAAEVASEGDDATREESTRLLALSEALLALQEEYGDELDAALRVAMGNGLEPPKMDADCPTCGASDSLDVDEGLERYCVRCGASR